MAPTVNASNTTFSQCSLDTIVPRSRSAACITGLAPADVSVASDLGTTRHPLGRTFELGVDVVNVGGTTALNVRADVLLPPSIVIDDAFVPGGTCTSGGGVIACVMGDIAGGATRVIHLALRSDVAGSNSISVRAEAANDAVSTNNLGDGTIAIEPEADLSVTVTGPISAGVGQSFNASFSVTNAAAVNAGAVVLTIDIPSTMDASASITGGQCTSTSGRIECRLPLLTGGATATGTLSATSRAAGRATVRARVAGAYLDPSPGNDAAEFSLDLTSTNSGVSAASGGGGGGSTSLLSLLAIGLSATLRRRDDRRRQ